MSLIISVLFICSGILSFFLFYYGILVSSKWQVDFLTDRILDGSVTSSLLIVITSLAWLQRRNKFGHLAFGILFLITAIWFYLLTAKLNYPTLSLKVKEGDLFPSEILSQTHKNQKIMTEEAQSSLIFVLPSLSNMFILHAVKRILEQKKQQIFNFDWHLIIAEEPLETPLLAILHECADIVIHQDNDIFRCLYDNESSSFSKINKPLFFILSSDNKIQWMLNPKSMHDLLLFDSGLEQYW